jgi:hypothetical protein
LCLRNRYMKHPAAIGLLTHRLYQVPSINSNTCQAHTPRLQETPLKWAATSFRICQGIHMAMISPFRISRGIRMAMTSPFKACRDICSKMITPSRACRDICLEMKVAHHTFHTIYNNSYRPATLTTVFFSNRISLPFSTMFPFTVH